MLLQLDDPALLPDLAEHFTRAGFLVRRVHGDGLQVTRPDAPGREQEEREVEIHLRVWRAMHPGRPIELARA